MGRAAWLSRTLILLVIIGLGLYLPTLFFDDAYITLRYAANLAHGGGFTYNPPEHVLGVTTPLLTLLLAAAARLGADLESAALVLGVAGHALLCLLVFEAVPLLVPEGSALSASRTPAALLAALICALHPHLAFTAVGGMETSLYGALIVGTLLAAARGIPWLAGALCGAALLTRPDAVLLIAPAAWLLCRPEPPAASRPRAALPALASALVVAGPWIVFAWAYFGSPVPHSIAAKRLIHPYGPGQVLADFGRFVRDDGYLIVALPLAVWTAALGRRPLAVAMGCFGLLHVGAVTLGGVEPFPWYPNPAVMVVLALGAVGCAELLARAGARAGLRPAWTTGLSAAVVAFVMVADIRQQAPGLRDAWDRWEGSYEVAGRWILNDSRPGDRVYVGETGVIGYLLPGRSIIDSSGINSPEVLAYRAGRSERDPEWSRRVVRELKPDYIATSEAYLNMETLAGEEWFAQLYDKMGSGLLQREGQVIYRRKRGP